MGASDSTKGDGISALDITAQDATGLLRGLPLLDRGYRSDGERDGGSVVRSLNATGER